MSTQFHGLTGVRTTQTRMMVLGLIFILGMFPANLFATEILLGTGPENSFSHFAGRAICRVINKNAVDFECRAIPASDDMYNLTNLQGGSLDVGLADHGVIYDAVHKKGQFEFLDIQYDNLRYLVPVYDQAILLVARSDAGIEMLDQLKGKRLNAGPSRSKTRQAVELIMGVKGWTEADFKIVEALPSSQAQDTMAFCHGSIQAIVHIGVHPDSALQKLMRLCSAVPVSMDDPDILKFIESHPAYSKTPIAKAVYPEFDQTIMTIGNTVSLVASGSLDDETVQTIMSVLEAHQKTLKHSHPAMGNWKAERTELPDIGLPQHPGALAYLSLREK